MEYEQMEYSRRVVIEAITRQDINGYYDLLSPDVLLVTHFPYPTTSTDSNVQAVQQWVQMSQQHQRQHGSAKFATATGSSNKSGNTSSNKSKRRAKELLLEQEKQRARQQKRYEAFRKRREGQHGGSTEGAGNITGSEQSTSAAAAAGGNGFAAQTGGDQVDIARSAESADAAAARSRHLPSKSTTAKKSAVGGCIGGSSGAARVPLGVWWFRQQQAQQQQQSGSGGTGAPQRSPTVPGRAGSTPVQASFTAAAAAAVEQNIPSDDGATLSYEDVVDIAEGRLLVSFRFFELLHWISTGKDITNIAPIELDVQLRKDILQEDEVLPLPPPPTSVQEQYEQLGTQFTERNQPLSCITVVWGRDYLLFKDKIYFDDGLIVTIQRAMLPVSEVIARAAPPASWSQHQQQRLCDRKNITGGLSSPLRGKMQNLASVQTEQAYKAVEAFYGVSTSRLNALNTSWTLLDYSFLEAPEPSALLRLTPVSGQLHVSRQPRAAADPRLAQGVFLNQNNDPGSTAAVQAGAARTLIKAKNKRGEEEAYEFDDNRRRFSLLQHGAGGDSGNGDGKGGDEWDLGNGPSDEPGNGKKKGDTGSAGANGVKGSTTGAVRGLRYDASCVRVSGCHLHSKMDQLVPVLRRLIANSLLTLHTLDLSQNNIATLPDLRLLPLQNLKLHDNAIADWRVVEHQIAPLPYLMFLTLHGNPIAEEREVPRLVAMTTTTGTTSVSGKGCAVRHFGAREGPTSTSGESSYWKKLLGLLLGNPTRVAPLRQVDFVTLTGQDFNLAGAHTLFTTGKSDVLDRARLHNAGLL